MSSFVPTPDVCFFSDFAEIILQECFQVRRPCVWIHGIPFEAKTEAVFLAHFAIHVGDFGCVSSQDFDTGWEYLYDGLVCPEAGAL